MTARERMLWKEAVRVLRQNSVTAAIIIEPPGAQRVLAQTRERVNSSTRV